MVPEAVGPSKFDEAKAALERGAFDEALHLLEVAHAEDPDDAQTRELYAVTHLAKAIRLSEKARQARQAALERPAIEYDQEVQGYPEVASDFDENFAALEDGHRVARNPL